MALEMQFTDEPLVPDDKAAQAATAAVTVPEEAAGGGDSSLPAKDAGMEAVERLAKEQGWRPKENFSGDADDWVSAEEFIRRGGEIQHQRKRTIDDLKKSVDELKTLNERVYRVENDKLESELQSLKEDRKAAIRESDIELVEELDAKIGEVSTQIAQTPAAENKATVHPAFPDWKIKNAWYGTDPEMTEMADGIAVKGKEDGLPLPAILKKVDKAAAELYPDRINGSGTKKDAEPRETVLGSTRGAPDTKGQTLRLSDLPQEAQESAKRFERQGIMSVAAYIKSYQQTL